MNPALKILLSLTILCVVGFNHVESTTSFQDKLLFVIGDSLFDSGNLYFLNTSDPPPTNSWPYGISLNNHSTGRFSDGLILPDFIAIFANLRPPPPFLNTTSNFSDGANFAAGGAGVFESHPKTLNLKQQIENLKSYVSMMEEEMTAEEAKKILGRSVLLYSLGGNDYMDFNTNNINASQTARDECVEHVIGNITAGFKALYEIGIRKVAIQNVGTLGLYPMVKEDQNTPVDNGICVDQFEDHAIEHNQKLGIAMNGLAAELPGFKYAIFDFNTELGNRITSPVNYGFRVGEFACCGTGSFNGIDCGSFNSTDGSMLFELCCKPDEYVLFDGGHNTQHTNSQLAQLFWNASGNVTFPTNVKTLFETDDDSEANNISSNLWSII